MTNPMTPDEKRNAAVWVVHGLRKAGHEAYFVGGCVRDLLLASVPKDYDVASSARPEQVRSLFAHVVMVGAQYGVCRVRRGRVEVEVATYRADAPSSDGRHPDTVHFCNVREDVLRRDFTINGMLMDPDDGQVLDFVGGQADLKNRLIRAIGQPSQRFAEDRLRLLRAVRFATRLGFAIEPLTLQAIRAQAHQIVAVSAERVRDELIHILTDGAAAAGLRCLADVGLLAPILPEVARLKGFVDPTGRLRLAGDSFEALVTMLAAMAPPSLPVALTVLLHAVGVPEACERGVPERAAALSARHAEAVLHRLRLPNQVIREVLATLADRERPAAAVAADRPSALKRLLRVPHSETLLAFHALEGIGSPAAQPPASYHRLCQLRRTWSPAELNPPRLIDGRDLQTWGYRPGPRFEQILNAVQDAQLDGLLNDRAAAQSFVLEKFSPES